MGRYVDSLDFSEYMYLVIHVLSMNNALMIRSVNAAMDVSHFIECFLRCFPECEHVHFMPDLTDHDSHKPITSETPLQNDQNLEDGINHAFHLPKIPPQWQTTQSPPQHAVHPS